VDIGNKKIMVIGGGPGGYVAAIRAAQLGGEVILIEKDRIGGTCLNVGCIPTKALLHTAEIYEEAVHGADYGVIANVRLDFAKAQERKTAVTNQLVSGVEGLLAVNKVKVISGVASFISNDTIEVKAANGGTETIKADRFIIATGSVPVKPPLPGIESKQCIDSTGALNLQEVPKTMVVIGGGVIGVEIATLYSTLGCKVIIIEMQNEILPMMDGELTRIIRSKLALKGVDIYTGAKVTGIKDEGAEAKVAVQMSDGRSSVFSCEKVLISVGRKTNTDALALDRAGIINDRGRITVNDKMETNVKGIYAIGDCTGKGMLAHIASAQGEVAAENSLGHESVFDIRTNPSCVYTNPEFASVGLTEEMAKEQGLDYLVGKFPLSANGRSLIMGGDGIIKFIVGKEYKEILGVHILGPRATDLIAECALAIQMEGTIDEIIATIHAHPTISEAVREAALSVEKRAIHMPNK